MGGTSSWSASVVALYVEHWQRLVRMAALLLDDTSASEDVVQEAFVRLNLKRLGGNEIDSQIAYVTTIVVNLSRSALRRRILATRHSMPPGGVGPSAETMVVEAFERAEVVKILRRLPRRQREALVLRYYGELTQAEVAESMQVSLGTVKSTLARATAAVAAMMEEER